VTTLLLWQGALYPLKSRLGSAWKSPLVDPSSAEL
jgi:hypothetical protein